MYAKYTRIFRTPKETSKIHQILAVLREARHQNSDFLGKVKYQILAVLREVRYHSDFLRDYVIASVAWQSPGRDTT